MCWYSEVVKAVVRGRASISVEKFQAPLPCPRVGRGEWRAVIRKADVCLVVSR